ncbi:MAG: HYExAFE family protein [Planctomycetota bacterium]
MAAATRHYESAFDAYLRAARAPYVSVRAARRALLSDGAKLTARRPLPTGGHADPSTLKTFDFVLYGRSTHLLLEIKGRRIPERALKPTRPTRPPRTESWVTLDDIESLRNWQHIFGPPFRPALAFLYWCPDVVTQRHFPERFDHDGRLYGIRAIDLDAYTQSMTVRSPRWRTVHLPAAAFDDRTGPLLGPAGLAADSSEPEPEIGSRAPALPRSPSAIRASVTVQATARSEAQPRPAPAGTISP